MSTRAVARLLRYRLRAIQTPPPVPTAVLGERRFATAAGAAAAEAEVNGEGGRWDLKAAREYEEYRRSIYGEITHRALLVDAVGTLVEPAQPMAQVSFDLFQCASGVSACVFLLDCNANTQSFDLVFFFDLSLRVCYGFDKKSKHHSFLI